MKARVKGTTDIIEVEFDKDALNACYPPYHDKEHDMYYQPEQLEWVDNEVNAEPDYWTHLEHQYAGMAMQGILSNPEYLRSLMHTKHDDYRAHEVVPAVAARLSHTLVEKMKEERK